MQVIEKTAALADHHQKTAAGTVILLVALQMFGEVVDAMGKQRDLHVSRAGVFLVQPEC